MACIEFDIPFEEEESDDSNSSTNGSTNVDLATAIRTSLRNHVLLPISNLIKIKKNSIGRVKKRCVVCSSPCSYYCIKCSITENGIIIPICNPFNLQLKTCYFHHCENPEQAQARTI